MSCQGIFPLAWDWREKSSILAHGRYTHWTMQNPPFNLEFKLPDHEQMQSRSTPARINKPPARSIIKNTVNIIAGRLVLFPQRIPGSTCFSLSWYEAGIINSVFRPRLVTGITIMAWCSPSCCCLHGVIELISLIHGLLLHTCTHHVRLKLVAHSRNPKNAPRTGPFSVCVCKLHEPGKAGDESQAQVAAMLSCIFSTKTSPSKHVFLLSQKTSCGWLIMFCLKFVTRKGERQRERERAREIRKTNAPSQRTSNSKTTLMLWRKALTNRGARHA